MVCRAILVVAILAGAARADDPKPVNLLVAVPTTVAVSSTVDNARIVPEHLVDGNLKTAWNSRTNDLVGAWIAVRVPPDTAITSIKLTAGFAAIDPKLGDLFTQNPRIKRVRVSRGGVAMGDFALDITNRGLQEIAVAAPGGELRITVVEVVPGTKRSWREICVSELEVWGTLPFAPPAKRLRPAVRVTSLDAPPTLSKAECLKAVFPTARGGRIAPEADADVISSTEEIGVSADVTICRIEHKQPKERNTTVELAAVKRATRAVLGTQQIPTLRTGDPEWGGYDSTVTITLLPLTTREAAVVVATTEHRTGPMTDVGSRATTVNRIGATGLEDVLSFKSTWDDGESTQRDTCTLREFAPTAALPKQLVLDCEETHGHWHDPDPKDRGTDVKPRVEKYVWDGTQYTRKP